MDKRLTAKTTTEAELRAYVEQGLNWVQIAEKTGIKAQFLRVAGSVLGIRSAYKGGTYRIGTARAEHVAQWVERLASGATLDEIAKAEGITRQSVYITLKRRGLPTTCRAAVRHRAEQPQA